DPLPCGRRMENVVFAFQGRFAPESFAQIEPFRTRSEYGQSVAVLVTSCVKVSQGSLGGGYGLKGRTCGETCPNLDAASLSYFTMNHSAQGYDGIIQMGRQDDDICGLIHAHAGSSMSRGN